MSEEILKAGGEKSLTDYIHYYMRLCSASTGFLNNAKK